MRRATLDKALKSISSKRKTYDAHHWMAYLTPVEILALYESVAPPIDIPEQYDHVRIKAMVRAGCCHPFWIFWPKGKDDTA